MRFLPIVLGWVIAASALSAIASIPGAASEGSFVPSIHMAR